MGVRPAQRSLSSLKLVTLLGVATAASAPSAGAAEGVTMGPDLSGEPPVPSGLTCSRAGGCLIFNEGFDDSLQGPPPFNVRSPADGTVVRWRVRNFAAGSGTGGLGFLTPRVVRPTGDGRFSPVATGTTRLIAGDDGAIHEFQTSLPIRAGDHLGVEMEDEIPHPLRSLRSGVQLLLRSGLADGASPEGAYWERAANTALLLAADVELQEPGDAAPPPPPPAPPPLTFNFLRLDPVRFVPAAERSAAAATELPEGSRISYRLSRDALVRLQVLRLTRGFREGERCTRRSSALTRRLRREIARELPRGLTGTDRRAEIRRRLAALRCAIDTPVPGATVLHDGAAGSNEFAYDAWAGGAPLPAGLYTLRGGAGAADGVVSDRTSRRFRILPAGVRLPRDLLTLSRRGVVRQPVYCRSGNRGGCRGTLELRGPLTRDTGSTRTAGRALGRARFRVPRRGARDVSVRLPAAARRLVRRHGRVRVTVRVRSRDDTGPAPTLERRMPLRESRRSR